MKRSNLLFISPTIPRSSGNGLGMRAYQVLRALSSEYDIYLMVVDHRPPGGDPLDQLGDLCRAAAVVPAVSTSDMTLLIRRRIAKISPRLFFYLYHRPLEWVQLTKKRIAWAFNAVSEVRFEAIHAFRLYTVPFVTPFCKSTFLENCQLDLDDIESVVRKRLGDLYARNGDIREATLLYREAQLYESLERVVLPRFGRVFVCSQEDGVELRNRCSGCRPEVLPNVVEIPDKIRPAPIDDPFTFLFVGTLRYYPNHDAIAYFIREILPLIRRQAKIKFSVKVVGTGLSDRLAGLLSETKEIEALGYVTDLTRVYEVANACIVPIRGGGGTRIKVLEAFSRKRAVVATTMGIEGIQATPGRDFLKGDTPEEFARQCLRLMDDPLIRESLTASAFELVRTGYGPEAMRTSLLAPSS